MARTHHTVHDQRAEWAWDQVSRVPQEHPAGTAKDYATHVRKLPARIQVNGLGQALAFLFAKSKSGKKTTGAGVLLGQLGARVTDILSSKDPLDGPKLMGKLVDLSPADYRRCTHELMLTAEWLKRFVDGLFDKEEDDHGAPE